MDKKTLITTSALGVGAVALLGGTFAFFSNHEELVSSGVGGTVGVETSDVTFGNSNNINPGDNDPYLPTNPSRPNDTDHDIEFSVENTGSKSIRTKHEISVSMENENLDPSIFMICDKDGKEVGKKYFKLNGKYVLANELNRDELHKEGNHGITEVRYVIASDIFDGVGTGAEKEEQSTVKEENGKASRSYSYQLAMSNEATDEYQGAKMVLKVETFAIQHRNTDASNWYKVSSEIVEGKTN